MRARNEVVRLPRQGAEYWGTGLGTLFRIFISAGATSKTGRRGSVGLGAAWLDKDESFLTKSVILQVNVMRLWNWKTRWAEGLLVLCGLAALIVLIRLPQWRHVVPMNTDALCWSIEEQQAQSQESPRGSPKAAVRDLGVQAVPVILRGIPEEGSFHFESVSALSQLGGKAIPDLLAGLDDTNPGVRLVALRALAGLRSELPTHAQTVLPALIKRLDDPDLEVRFADILLLGRLNIDRSSAVPALTAALTAQNGEADEDPIYIRQAAAYVLGKIGPAAQSALPELSRVLSDPSLLVQQEAAVAIWRITRETNGVMQQLSGLLRQSDPCSRREAVVAMARIQRDVKASRARLEPALAAPSAH